MLIPNEINPNRMSPEKFGAFVGTIKRWGQTRPIQVAPLEKGKYEIIDGEHVYRAMKELGLEECEVNIRPIKEKADRIMAGLESNIHGENIPVQFGLAIARANEKYPVEEIARRIGEAPTELAHSMDLSRTADERKKMADAVNKPHVIEIDFLLDTDAEGKAKAIAGKIEAYAGKLGAKKIETKIKINALKNSIVCLRFDVSEPQSEVIKAALEKIMKQADCGKSAALEYMSANFLQDPNFKKPQP